MINLGILASSFQGAVAGDYESIETFTVGGGGATSITFSSIAADWQHLQIRFMAQSNRGTYAIDNSRMRFNSDTGSNYADHVLGGAGSNPPTAFAETSQTSALTGYRNLSSTAAPNIFGVGVIDILDYTNVNKYKTFRSLSGEDLNGTVAGFAGAVSLSSGLWMSTTAINSINLFPEYGSQFTQYSSFALYGIK